ncbi:signal peptidase I Serine peptidase. MEROPS family S26A [Bryocella elongata]|uniref:Signal peptidase I n=1 Tax=Bryocella elongata TaxID=863522 RepID=A0A1H6BRV9_9BACT|nr:signal peptidase I [Bryocella elongata]SEG63195.1 signal peptidase I Serine peptidase. MEROPS family S26A [Bryocella elongata]
MSTTPLNPVTEPQTIHSTEPELQTETPLEAIASIAFVLAIGLWVMGFVFQNFVIPSGSMEKTLLIGDHVVVDRETLSPATTWAPFVHYRPVQRGDIIVFFKPNPESPDLILVKRAMAIAGDHIHLEHGHVFINGKPVQEGFARMPDDSQPGAQDGYIPYRDDFPAITPDYGQQLTEVWRQELPTRIVNGDVVVPPGKVFAMGDNRTESLDSRYWGFVPVENIMGRPLFVYWSFLTPADEENKTSTGERVSFMFHVLIHIFDQTRWSRTLHVVK